MQKFLDHLRDPSPGFRCYKPNSPDEKPERDIRVEHKLGPPAGDKDIAALCSKLGEGSEQFEPLYSRHNGMTLYAPGAGVEMNADWDAGIIFYAVKKLKARNAEWREWFDWMDDEDLYEFQRHGVAFGEILASGNYFVWWQGKVYYSDHDDCDGEPYGTLSEFLDRIAENPAGFLEDAGCYTRYGKEQWIPGVYVPEMG